jgi:TrmH RNA methyltransferase
MARVAGLPAVSALFSTAPERVERLFFDERARPSAARFCAELARAHKPYRLVGTEELDRIAGTVLHGGIVAIARPSRSTISILVPRVCGRAMGSRS